MIHSSNTIIIIIIIMIIISSSIIIVIVIIISCISLSLSLVCLREHVFTPLPVTAVTPPTPPQ